MPEGSNRVCEGCHGEITPNQIIARQAGLVNGVLLCPQCIAKKREELMRARAVHQATTAEDNGAEKDTNQGRVYFPPVHEGEGAEDASLTLVSEEEVGRVTHKIRSFAEGSTLAGVHHEEHFKRPLAAADLPATRCRTFHGKLTAAGLAHMDEQINDWLDSNSELFIKASSSTVGIFEGKSKEPHLLVTVFY
ncbi:MAG: hypothetical protein KF841_13395 [Phycisphaerae bacterium]|nr:hypothetical protein [Phycisphaerae bacterium]